MASITTRWSFACISISTHSFIFYFFILFLINLPVLAATPDKAPRKLKLRDFLLCLYNKYHSSHSLSTYTFVRCYHNAYYKTSSMHLFYTYCIGSFKFSLILTYTAFCLKILISPCSLFYNYLFFFLCFFTCPRCSSRHLLYTPHPTPLRQSFSPYFTLYMAIYNNIPFPDIIYS